MIKTALAGKMGAGKNTVADYLRANYGFHQFAFGDALKWAAHMIFDVPSDGKKPRDLYQFFGQMCREYDPDVWVKNLDKQVARFSHAIELTKQEGNKYNVVITDLRQSNEFEYCRENGYYIIRVKCRDDIRIERMKERGDNFDLSALNHETESYVDTFDVDFEIDNNGRWIDMANQVDVIMREIQLREGVKR